MAHINFWYGQKWKKLTFFIKQKTIVYKVEMIYVLWKNSKFFIFDDVKSQNGSYLAEMEKWSSKSFIWCIVHGKASEYR